MKSYIGAKIILAKPEDKDGKEGYKVVYPDGYESWSPKNVFEQAYREVSDGETDLIIDVVASDVLSDDELKEIFDAETDIIGDAMPEPELEISE